MDTDVMPDPDGVESAAQPSKLEAAVATLRRDLDTPEPDAPEPETPDAEAPETPAPEPAAAEVAPTDTGTEAEPAPEAGAPKTFSVDVPVKLEGGREDVLQVEGLPQEFADGIRYHVKRSTRDVPKLEAKVEALRPEAEVGTFVKQRPLEAMHLLATEQPDAAQRFVESYLVQNWRSIGPLIAKIGVGATDERSLDIQAQLAQRDARDAVLSGVQATRGHSTVQDYVNDLSAQAQEIAQGLGLQGQDHEDFQVMAAEAVTRLAKRLNVQTPPVGDALAEIQRVAMRFGNRPPGTPSPTQTPEQQTAQTRQTLKQRAQTRDKFARLQQGSVPKAQPTGLDKVRAGKTMADRLKALKGR